MSVRSKSPLSPGRGRKPSEAPVKKALLAAGQSSPVDRAHVSGQMQDIFSVVKKLRDEKASLETELALMSQRTESEEKRFIKDICKSRVDLENVTELMRLAADGIDTKSTANIPELPEAAVAKVVPRGLRTLLDSDYGDYSSAGATVGHEIASMKTAVNASFIEYERVAESGKGLVWDVERLNMIIQAYEGDLVKLAEDSAHIKADINKARLKWRTKFSACRRWQDFTRRSHVLKFQEQLDQLQDDFEDAQAGADKELEAILELIGTRRMRDNKAKLTLFLKKMQHAKLYKVWRGWKIFHDECQREKFGERSDLAALSAAEKLALMKSKEREAMLRCFLKRWANLKLAVPFVTWASDILARKAAARHALLEAEHAALLARMSAMDGSATAQKLKLIYARVAGKMKDLTFRALKKNKDQAKLARLGEDEKFKRLKVFLEAKLKGVKYSTFHCLYREYKDMMAARIQHNHLALRVAAFLEMKAKGMRAAIFSAFKRNQAMGSREQSEIDRLKEIAEMRHSQSLQRLKVFLSGKEARLKFAFFSFWSKVVVGSTEMKMRQSLHAKQKERAALEAKLRALENELGGSFGADTERALQSAAQKEADLEHRIKALEAEIAAARKRLKAAEEALAAAQEARSGDGATIKKLQAELEDARVDKEALEQEFSLIVDQIGFLTEYSK